MRYRIGIYDRDMTYCTHLMEYINMNKSYMLHSICFSDAEPLLESIHNNQIDLVLYGQNTPLMAIIRDSCRTMRLADSDEAMFVGEKYLYKYQRADVLAKQILDFLEVEIDRVLDGVVFYGVYSPVGRSGKTSLALGICCNNPGSLYVGVNSYIGSTDVSDYVFSQTERFFYQLLTHNEDIVATIQDVLENQGGTYVVFYGMRCFLDYRQLSASDIDWFRKLLEQNGLLTHVVFDIGAAVLSDFNILNAMDQIFVPCLSDAYANRQMKHFRMLLGDSPLDELRGKLDYIEVPARPYDSQEMREFVRRCVR